MIPIGTFLLGLLLAIPAHGADQRPRWELGIGAYTLSLPDYRGSEQRQSYLLPFPYLQYRGPRLRWDREGGRYRLMATAGARLDLSLSASPPADSDDNRIRQGMPDLDPVVELGPELQLNLGNPGARQRSRWRLVLPLRAAVASDLRRAKAAGWVFAPYVQYRDRDRWTRTLSFGPLWATEGYHDYFYEVAPAFATSTRPGYDAAGGYSGARMTFNLSRRIGGWWVGGFVRYDNLSGATFSDSPLLETDHSFMVGAGVARILARSANRKGHASFP